MYIVYIPDDRIIFELKRFKHVKHPGIGLKKSSLKADLFESKFIMNFKGKITYDKTRYCKGYL